MSFEIKKFGEERQMMIDTMRQDLIGLINPLMNHLGQFADTRERHNAITRLEEAIGWVDKCIVMFEPAVPVEGELEQANPEAEVAPEVATEAVA